MYDVWFSRYEDRYYVVWAEHDEAPDMKPRRLREADTPARMLRRVKAAGKEVVQVGILPPEMIGLEVEV